MARIQISIETISKAQDVVGKEVDGLRDLQAAAVDSSSVLENRLKKALLDAGVAADRLAQAQDALANNTDPGRQLELASAVADAQVALDQERESLAQVGQSAQDASFSFTELNSAIQIAGRVVRFVGDTFDFAQKRAERLGRTDISSNIEDMHGALEKAVDAIVQVNIGGRDFLEWTSLAADRVTALADASVVHAGAVEAVHSAVASGNLTQQEANVMLMQLKVGSLSAADALAQLGVDLGAEEKAVIRANDAWGERMAGLARHHGFVQDYVTDAEKLLLAEEKRAETLGYLHTVMTPVIGDTEDYDEAVTKLEEKIRRMERAQGGVIPQAENYGELQGDLTETQLRLADAQYDAVVSAERLGEAQRALAENTDPEKQAQLENALVNAQIAMGNTQERLGDLGGDIGELNEQLADAAGGGIADYTTAIGKARRELDGLRADHLVDVSQGVLGMAENMGLSEDALLAFAGNMGLIDEKTVQLYAGLQLLKDPELAPTDVAAGLEAAAKAMAEGGNPQEAIEGVIEWRGELRDTVEFWNTESKDVVASWDAVKGAIQGPHDLVWEYDQMLRNLPSEVTTHLVIIGGGPDDPHRSGGGGGGGTPVVEDFHDSEGATGADFIVPQGYPNDSYSLGLTSGERVQVTPAGQQAGGQTIQIFLGEGAIQVRDPMTLASLLADIEMQATPA